MQERQEMAKVIGDISNNAINIATYNEREKINKLGLEKFKLEEQEKALKGQAGNEQQLAAIKQQLTSVQAEITKTQGEIDRTYGIGSKTGMAIRAVTAALQAAAQNDTAGSLVALASPYLNKTIHEMTAGDTAKDKAANLMAHALLSAVEFQVTGKDPLTGAVAGVTGEVTAQILTQAIYNKTPNQLTANEKENISTLSQLAGGLAAALTAKANGVSNQNGGGMALAVAGAETSKRAVENNFGFIEMAKNPEYTKGLWVKAQADEIVKSTEEEVIKDLSDRLIPHYTSGGISYGPLGIKFTINNRNGEMFTTLSYSNELRSGSIGWGANIGTGWILNLDKNELRRNLSQTINDTLVGYSMGVEGCYYGCIGYGETISPTPKKILSIGVGQGLSIGTEYTEKLK